MFKNSANQVTGPMHVSIETSMKLIKYLIKTVIFLSDFALNTVKFHFSCILLGKRILLWQIYFSVILAQYSTGPMPI